MSSTPLRRKALNASTLTIRIDEGLKDDVIAIAHASGEDVSTWIRRFFEDIRRRKGSGRMAKGTGDEEGIFTQEFIDDVLEAGKRGSFTAFNLKDYV